MAEIKIKSSCIVGMGSNLNAKSRIELTPFDLLLLPIGPIQRGILFHKPADSGKPLIDHLKTSLSRTLDFFPPLAGRLATIENDDNTTCYFVDCNNAGVEFVHAAAGDVCVSDILEPTYVPGIVNYFFSLNYKANYEGVSKPLLGVQVTELVDGLFIGCTANHAVVDGTSFWHFFNSWSEISHGFDTISKIPVFDRWFPTSIADEDRLVPFPPFEPKKSVPPQPLQRRVFHFSKESLSKLKDRANAEAGTDKISSLQALSAHLWRSTTRSASRQQSHSQEALIYILIGARGRIPLPGGYFGNAAYPATTTISEAELLQKGLGYAALKINELVTQQTNETAIKFVEDWMKNRPLWKGFEGRFTFAITSSPRHNVYGNDFGWGKPIAVRSGKLQKFNGKVLANPTAEAGGVDAEVCLAPEVLQAMGDDAEFMEAFSI